MGASLSLLTASLLVGQVSAPMPDGKNCVCNTKATSGPVFAQPDGFNETRTMSWWNWRGSSSSSGTTTSGATTSEWRTTTGGQTTASAPPEGSWIDNRPVLSRFRGLFRRDGGTIQQETIQPNSQVITQPTAPITQENFRRLPTNKEPPLGAPVIISTPPPIISAPATTKPAESKPFRNVPPATIQPPLTIEVEPIEFRPAGQVKGIRTADSATASAAAPEVIKSETLPPSRPNPISPRFMNKVGQPGDYSWITGQLEIRGNTYILHYASPETIDRFNGSLVLIGNGKLANLRSGDLVSVHGRVLQQGQNAAYQATSADLVER